MARRCTICDHPSRSDIDRALLRREGGLRVIAKRYGTSPTSLYRHHHNHLKDLVAQGLAAEQAAEGTAGSDPYALELAKQKRTLDAENAHRAIDAVAQLRAINGASLEVLRQAREDGKPTVLLKAVDRIVRQIELQAKLLGQIHEGPTINIAVLPEWHGIRQRLLDALRPYQEARLAVVEALKGDLP